MHLIYHYIKNILNIPNIQDLKKNIDYIMGGELVIIKDEDLNYKAKYNQRSGTFGDMRSKKKIDVIENYLNDCFDLNKIESTNKFLFNNNIYIPQYQDYKLICSRKNNLKNFIYTDENDVCPNYVYNHKYNSVLDKYDPDNKNLLCNIYNNFLDNFDKINIISSPIINEKTLEFKFTIDKQNKAYIRKINNSTITQYMVFNNISYDELEKKKKNIIKVFKLSNRKLAEHEFTNKKYNEKYYIYIK